MPTTPLTPRAEFTATRWSVVLAAGGQSRQALEELAGIYWYPLYAYLRRRGFPASDAEDRVQSLFARLLENQSLASVDPAKGRFRSFLLASLQHIACDEHDRSTARKRGGGRSAIPLDQLDAESRYALEPVDDMTPQRLFERRWALALLDQVLAKLRAEYLQRGSDPFFDALITGLTGAATAPSHANIAESLDTTPGAVKVAAHRLRRRYRQLLREEIAQTVTDPQDIDDEIRYLLGCLSVD